MAKNLEGLTIDICLPEVWFSVNLSVPKIYFALLVSTNESTVLIKTDQSQAQDRLFNEPYHLKGGDKGVCRFGQETVNYIDQELSPTVTEDILN